MRVARPLVLLACIAVLLSGCNPLASQSPTPPPIIIIATPDSGPPTQAAGAPTLPPATPDTPSPADAPTAAVSAPTDSSITVATTAAPPQAQLQIQLSQATLTAIFRGEITGWNDPRVQADNPGAGLPDLPIQVIYRSDSSGTTRAITEYFVQVDQQWAEQIGAAYRLGDAGSKPWPAGRGTNGSSQLTRAIRDTPGAIGYAAPSFAQQAGLPVAIVQNAAGNQVSVDSSTLSEAAANTVERLDERLRGFVVNAPGQNAYPMALYTWIISCPSGMELAQAQALTDFLYWALTDSQAIATARRLEYEPLPSAVRQRAIAQLESFEVGGQRVFSAPVAGEAFRPRRFEAPVSLSGAGATLPAPLYQELIEVYQRVQPDVALSYDPLGSTKGREDLLQSGFVQFAGTEEAVVDNDPQITRPACLPAPPHIPMVVGAVGIVYNLPSGR
ncbi:MAG TPA: substrate-binding domain-containing protein [Roseiflexaceae bacterium]|nr:substrate-binding domain-containing protein [Roseiflexaceae bacterium]